MLDNTVFKLVALGITIPVLLVISLGISYQESSSTGVIVPAYVSPTSEDWENLFNATGNHTRVISMVIFNCGDPGGPCAFNQAVQDNINTAQSKGMKPLGYVATSNGDRSAQEVKGDIDLWETEYDGIEGIFFDEMDNTVGNESYYSDLTAYVKENKTNMDFTVGNPGTDTIPSYIDTVDNIVIWENSVPADIVTQLRGQDFAGGEGWHTNFDKSNFSYLEWDKATFDSDYVVNASNHVAYVYITDDGSDGNPWDSIPDYIETLYATLDVPSVGITVESKDLSGTPITATDNNTKISVFNVLARNASTSLFYNVTNNTTYTVTVSDFDTFIFDHWEDSSTNPTRTVTPTANSTYTAFYNDTSAPPPETVSLLVESADLSGETFEGIYIELFLDSSIIDDGFTPFTTTIDSGVQYEVFANNFEDIIFDHWEDSSTEQTRSFTITQDTNFTAFYQTGSSPSYIVDLLDVYQSSSATLDSGTAVCLDVDLKNATSCAGSLTAESTYRFEIEVDNIGGADGLPTSFELRDVVTSGDVLGSIPEENILGSGCDTNTDWTEIISTNDINSTNGTACQIPSNGSAEYWMIVTLGSDAADGTGSFSVSDGTESDTSAATTFSVNPPPTVSLNVTSASMSGEEITGMWIELWKDGNLTETGHTPFSTTVDTEAEYEVFAGSFEDRVFDHWDDGSTSQFRTFNITQDTTFTAFYDITLSHKFVEVTEQQTTTSATYTDIPGATIPDADLEDGDNYLLVFGAWISHNNTAQNGFIQTIHGSTPFEGSEFAIEPPWRFSESRYPYFWFTVWNAAAGESVNLQFRSEGGDVMRADQITMTAINLSEELTQGADYHFASVTADTAIPNLYTDDTNTASVTFTPNGTDNWLVLATAQLDPDSVSNSFQTRINANGGVTDTALEWVQEGEDATNDRMVQSLAKVYTPTSTSTTFEVETQSGSGGTKLFNSIFALNLNKTKNHSFQAIPGGIEVDPGNSFATATNVATATLDPDSQGDVWVLAFDVWHPHNLWFVKQRMQVDDADQPATQTSDAAGTPDSPWATTDKIGYFMQSIENLTDSPHTVDLDATTGDTGLQVRDRLVMIMNMKLGFIFDLFSPSQFYLAAQNFDSAILALQNIFLPLPLGYADAQGAPVCRNDSCNLHQKIVMILESPLSESELQSTLNNNVIPLIEDSLTARFDGKMTNVTTNNVYNLFKTDTGVYEFYPDFNVLGNTNMTNVQMLQDLDSATADIQNILDNSTSSLEASSVHYYIQKSTGPIDTRK